MSPLELVNLSPLMARTRGRPSVRIGLIDGPVALTHGDLTHENLREIAGANGAACARADSMACLHGTFVAGILAARRGSPAPAICPDCTLLIRPLFAETVAGTGPIPSAKPDELAQAIIDCLDAGAAIINLSLGLAQPSVKAERKLDEALRLAVKRGALVIAAAGNQGTLGSSAITRAPWVIPIVAADGQRRPMGISNLGSSIGRNGLTAPGDAITSLGASGKPVTLGGTSAAVPFVTGTAALLWSEFPQASAAAIKSALLGAAGPRRMSVVPPLLNAEAAYRILTQSMAGRHVA